MAVWWGEGLFGWFRKEKKCQGWPAAVLKKKKGEKIGLGFFLLYFSGVSKINPPSLMC